MIVFFAPYPINDEEKKGGLCQRILSIDSLFENHERIYLTVSYTKYKKPEVINISDKIIVYRLNALKDYFLIKKLIKKSSLIYLHTIGNALKYLPYLKPEKIKVICDMHGVVPEECRMFNQKIKSFVFNIVEFLTLLKVDYIICVSNNMVKHFDKKYRLNSFEKIVIPIFTRDRTSCNFDADSKIKNLVIYAGGTQVWQNTSEMLDLANDISSESLPFHFWFPEKDYKKYSNFNLNDNIYFSTGSNADVINDYMKSCYGLILRDDNVVNNVACPTKIVEYLQYGLIPIVKSKEIGDFSQLGLEYITIFEIKNNVIGDLELKRNINNNVLIKFYKQIDNGIKKLEIISGCELKYIKLGKEI
ncbi:hypothetical protein LZS94_10810 [Aliivibrio fischeri]|uniref:hypothetical protein n=1 Tax=Aliivibrio fischeri TaxID=668 RepID=UPI001F23583A|nr:hypothetical protein [Aliivibrio fischeri]MCE7577988.1 hypothetical protein [Aliivibrio fischeri]MCE7590376.1 hypothetical protein [Aliivibrio fischeri]